LVTAAGGAVKSIAAAGLEPGGTGGRIWLHKSPHLAISGGEINCIELNTKIQIARARSWQGKEVLWIECKRGKEGREKITGAVGGVDARSAENVRWALRVAGAVASGCWHGMVLHVSRKVQIEKVSNSNRHSQQLW
jgi:hypothetical protein